MARKLGMYLAAPVWVQMKSPDNGDGDNNLYGVAATSARNAWAVGEYFVGVNTKSLVEHCG